jgi:hypothetical protein
MKSLFDHRVRGFRIVELGGLCVLMALVLTVYLSKAGAGGERADIDRVQQQIADEQTRIRLLTAEVSSLEQPERLTALSARYLDMQPVPAKHEVGPDALPDIALIEKVKTPPAAPTPGAQPPASSADKADH